MMKKFMQGRFLVTSLVRNYSSSFQPIPRQKMLKAESPKVRQSRYSRPLPRGEEDEFGTPKRVLRAIGGMEELLNSEKVKYGYLFSELLGLPKPPKLSTDQEEPNKFAVKLVKFEGYNKRRVLTAIACAKWNEEVRSMEDLLRWKSWLPLVDNVPSVIKQGVTVKEAKEIIANIKAAGGEAVMFMEDSCGESAEIAKESSGGEAVMVMESLE